MRPTTRQGRYLYYRQRFAHRESVRPRSVRKWYLDGGVAGGTSTLWKYPERPNTSHASYFVKRVQAARPGSWQPAWSGFELNGPPFASWPHVTATSTTYLADRATGEHRRYSSFAYHLRRVKGRARKSDRMDGPTRRVWAATFYARMQGFYPDWDVLGRHPNQFDVEVLELPYLPHYDPLSARRGPKYLAPMPGA